MILVLDDVVDLNSTFQNDSMKILNELDQPNINEKWYSLEEQHPFDNFCNPKIERIRVVFPEPFGPIRPIVSPDLMLKFILRRISFSPIETLRFETIVSVIAIYSEI